MKSRYVGNAPFFASLSEEEQERVSERMHLERRRNRELLFSKGEDSTALYLIESGWVQLLADGGSVLASQGPGSLVGETDLFLDRPRSVGVSLASDAELWVLTKDDLVDLIAETPQIGLRLTMSFGSRLALFDRYLVEHRLGTLTFLSGIEEQSLGAVARRLVPLEKKKGEFIVEEGQPPEALFVVESGQVHLHSSEEGGDFSELGAGETFGEMALLTGKPHARSAQAASDTMLWALPVAEFESLTEERPDIRLALSQSIHEPLTGQDMGRAVERLSTISLFADLPEDVLWAVAQRMLLRHVPAGEEIFAQGSPGDALYLIDNGQVEILSDSQTGRTVLARLGMDEFFGEMALLTGKPRSSSARTATHANLWVLYRADFEDLVNRYPALSVALSKVLSERLAAMDQRFTENHLRGLNLLAGLSTSQLEDISRRLKPVRYRQGEQIVREGEPGEEMFFIESGRVQVVRGTGPQAMLLAEMGAGDLFGEMSLLTGNPRSATVAALSDIDLWVMTQSDFDTMVTAYPNLGLALSRLLSERLRSTDARPLHGTATVPVQAQTHTVAATAPQQRPAPKAAPKKKSAAKPVRRTKRRSVVTELNDLFGGAVGWFGSLSTGAKIRLLLVVILIAWMLCIAAPMLVISTLAADNVTNMQGAIAFVQTSTPSVTDTPQAPPSPVVVYATVMQPTYTPLPPTDTPAPTEVVVDPTQTPWVIVVTATPLPVTDTPVPSPTPVPPTATPEPPKEVKSVASAPKPLPSPTPAMKQQAPRDLDPRISALNVGIEPAGVKPGQSYWRLTAARWENEQEAGGDHTIYVNLLDEGGGRVIGQPIEIKWVGGSLNVVTENKPPNEFPSNFPMYNTLGSYSVSIPGLPSDTVVGLGLGSIEQPDFKVHTNFFLTFQRVTR